MIETNMADNNTSNKSILFSIGRFMGDKINKIKSGTGGGTFTSETADFTVSNEVGSMAKGAGVKVGDSIEVVVKKMLTKKAVVNATLSGTQTIADYEIGEPVQLSKLYASVTKDGQDITLGKAQFYVGGATNDDSAKYKEAVDITNNASQRSVDPNKVLGSNNAWQPFKVGVKVDYTVGSDTEKRYATADKEYTWNKNRVYYGVIESAGTTANTVLNVDAAKVRNLKYSVMTKEQFKNNLFEITVPGTKVAGAVPGKFFQVVAYPKSYNCKGIKCGVSRDQMLDEDETSSKEIKNFCKYETPGGTNENKYNEDYVVLVFSKEVSTTVDQKLFAMLNM